MTTEHRPVYDVTVTREDNLWVAEVKDLRGGATDAERFADLNEEVRDLIAGLTDTDLGHFDVRWHYVQRDHDFTTVIEALRTWEEQAELAMASRDEARRAAIGAMRRLGLSVRDVADVVGLSHQRISQLERASHPRAEVTGQIRTDRARRPA
jgi:predicted RNase H-like HicB family nuclease